jgi:8-oxo-dGTP diphosphatase/2-hydroxy-dATP diphosphatase
MLLLGMKRRGFGIDKWNGFGGKVESDETIEDAARRELLEESGITATVMEKMGIMEFEFRGQEEVLQVHVFHVKEFIGEPRASEEMLPVWFHKNNIPYSKMWLDDQFWLRLLMWGKKFTGKFVFDADGTNIVDMNLQTIDELV